MPDGELMSQLAKEYGDGDGKLRQLPVQVLSNDIEDVMQSAYVWYAGKTCGARSDSETVTWFNDPTNGKHLDEPRTEAWNDDMLLCANSKGVKLFKLHTVFNCVIASKEARFGGVYKFRTTSVISGRQLYSSMIEVRTRTYGVLMGLPLRLVVRPVQVSPDGQPTTVYVVHTELHGPSLAAIQTQALDQMKVFAANREQIQGVQAQYKRMLLPPGTESQDEARDINEEFQPETVAEVIEREPPPGVDPLLAGVPTEDKDETGDTPDTQGASEASSDSDTPEAEPEADPEPNRDTLAATASKLLDPIGKPAEDKLFAACGILAFENASAKQLEMLINKMEAAEQDAKQ